MHSLNSLKERLLNQIDIFTNDGKNTKIPEEVLNLLISGNNTLLDNISSLSEDTIEKSNIEIIVKMIEKNDNLIERMFNQKTQIKRKA